jgi:RNA polymerase sigma-70 factor (ECF subfamily)
MQIAETEPHACSDDAVIARVLAGDHAAFEVLMRRYNRRVFRAARAVLRDEAEAEDVAQDAWVRAYAHLRQFAGRASFATWLTRIAIYEALARRRHRVRHQPLDPHAATLAAGSRPPDHELGARQMAAVLEDAIDRLPVRYRTAFVLRDLEGLSTSETATCLEVPEATVKTRLHRARALLRTRLDAALGVSADGVYEFGGARCDRIVAAVLARIRAAPVGQPIAAVPRRPAS